jgi:hypothetical protein
VIGAAFTRALHPRRDIVVGRLNGQHHDGDRAVCRAGVVGLGRIENNPLYLPKADLIRTSRDIRYVPIVLQKSKVARPRIFRENTKREVIADSFSRNRVAEVAWEFDVRR